MPERTPAIDRYGLSDAQYILYLEFLRALHEREIERLYAEIRALEYECLRY